MGHNVSMHAGGSKSGGSHLREEQFSGVALIQLISAQLQLKGKWFACVAIGEQTFLTATSIHTDKPEWKSERTVVLEANGPRIVRISVHEVSFLALSLLLSLVFEYLLLSEISCK
jgi:phosphatidylserine decarboxylase